MLYSVVRQEVESIVNLGIGRKYVLHWIDSHWIDIYPGHENRTSSDVPKQLFCFLFGFFSWQGTSSGIMQIIYWAGQLLVRLKCNKNKLK